MEEKRGKNKRGDKEGDSRNLYIFFFNSMELVCHRSPDPIYQNSLSQEREKT